MTYRVRGCRQPYCWGDKKTYDDYYTRQTGAGAVPVFSGAMWQRGHGLGNLFAGLARAAVPLLGKFAGAVGKKALTTGTRLAGDILAGKNVKKAVKRRATSAGKDLLRQALSTAVAGQSSGGGSRSLEIIFPPRKKQRRTEKKKRKKQQSGPPGRRAKDIFD